MFVLRFASIACCVSTAALLAQPASPVTAPTTIATITTVPRMVRINSTFRPASGAAASPLENATFSIYAEETGGSPLWQETQNIAIDSDGHYSALLGVTRNEGLPVDLFGTGESRWLGVQFQRAGEAEQPRVRLASVPYALKAVDADTLGGRPASAYMLDPNAAAPGSSSVAGALSGGSTGTTAIGPNKAKPKATSGTPNTIAMFTSATDLGNSVMTQDATGKVGLGTTAPHDYFNIAFNDTTGGFTGYAVQNLGNGANSYSGMLFYDQTGALGQFQGFNNTTHEYRINNVANSGSINFMLGGSSKFLVAANGNVGIGNTAPNFKLDVGGPINANNATATGNVFGVQGTSASPNGAGVSGVNSVTTSGFPVGVFGTVNGGFGAGVFGSVNAANATGVQGTNNATSGFATGISGFTNSPDGPAINGTNNSVTGNGVGVGGSSNSPNGAGVSGFNSVMSGGFPVGVRGAVNGTSGAGVFGGAIAAGASGVNGNNSATSGNFAPGIYGSTNSKDSPAIIGNNNATTGEGAGIAGNTGTPNGAGVAGFNSYTGAGGYPTGVTGGVAGATGAGVQGNANMAGAIGVNGNNSATTGFATGVNGSSSSPNGSGVFGNNSATTGNGIGVNGNSSSPNGAGVAGFNNATTGFPVGVQGGVGGSVGAGVAGNANAAGATAVNGFNSAMSGYAVGVNGGTNSNSGAGVQGNANNGAFGVVGFNSTPSGFAVGTQGVTSSPNGIGVQGQSMLCGMSGCTLVSGTAGQFVTTTNGKLLQGLSGASGSDPGTATQVFVVDGQGNLTVTGTITGNVKNFKIDNPLDPTHKDLRHASIESSEMANIYSGNVVLNAKGEAIVKLPEWFEALNSDFRYQLTTIGHPAPVYIASQIHNNRFKIAGGRVGMKVSWQVTGIRHDDWALSHPLQVESNKPTQ